MRGPWTRALDQRPWGPSPARESSRGEHEKSLWEPLLPTPGSNRHNSWGEQGNPALRGGGIIMCGVDPNIGLSFGVTLPNWGPGFQRCFQGGTRGYPWPTKNWGGSRNSHWGNILEPPKNGSPGERRAELGRGAKVSNPGGEIAPQLVRVELPSKETSFPIGLGASKGGGNPFPKNSPRGCWAPFLNFPFGGAQ